MVVYSTSSQRGAVKLCNLISNGLIRRCKATAASPSALKEQHEAALEDELSQAKPFEEMPSHKIVPFFGTTWVMFPVVGKGLDVTQSLKINQMNFKQFGHIWRDVVPGMPPIVTTVRPEDAERLFRSEGKFPERPGFETLKKYRAERVEHFDSAGILVGQGEDWWKIRSKAQQPFLKTKNVLNYMPVLGRIAQEFIERIYLIRPESNEMGPDFVNEMYRWALESVGVVALNTRLGCLSPDLTPDSEAMKMIAAANLSFAAFNELEYGLPVWKVINTPMLKKMFEAQDFFTETSIKYINQTMEALKQRSVDSEEDHTILEDLLIRGLSLKEAVVMVIDMLMAGIDTTSHTTSFLLYFLARNPEKQEKLRQEVLDVVGPLGSPITPKALNELHFLKACIKESLRIMPAAIGNARFTEKDLVLSGYRVPKGTLVAAMHQVTANLEEYFPNPEAFIPERWIKGHPQESHHHPYAVLPFGFGTRMCIGRRLAELEMWQLTVKILQNFNVEYHHEDIGCVSRLVNIPDKPLRFKFIDL